VSFLRCPRALQPCSYEGSGSEGKRRDRRARRKALLTQNLHLKILVRLLFPSDPEPSSEDPGPNPFFFFPLSFSALTSLLTQKRRKTQRGRAGEGRKGEGGESTRGKEGGGS
jgi:hypothetical protein